MDRSHSRFPAGSVGLALFLLRLAAGFGLVSEGIHLLTIAATPLDATSPVLLGLPLVASAIMLILGLRTTIAGSAAAVCTAASVLSGMDRVNLPATDVDAWFFLLALLVNLSISLALTGPGGYSLDARLSGWRKIRLSSRKLNGPNECGTLS